MNRRLLLAIISLLSLMVILALFPAIVFGRTPPDWLPQPVVNWGFDILLNASPYLKKVSSLSSGSIQNDRVYLDTYGENISFSNDGLEIAGTLYKPDQKGGAPAILLIHGSTPEGRKLGIYRMLGKKLAEKGYIVLSIDLRGYGESDDPVSAIDPLAFDTVSDAMQALSYLSARDDVNSDSIYILGHSGGSDEAILAGIQNPIVKKIVVIGPPRRFSERSEKEERYFLRRMIQYMKLEQPISKDVYSRISEPLALENHLDYFNQSDHKPILLIDGMLESEDDRVYLQRIVAGMSEPKKYLTLANSDHYANIANFGNVVFYDEQVIEDLVEQIVFWLTSNP